MPEAEDLCAGICKRVLFKNVNFAWKIWYVPMCVECVITHTLWGLSVP